MPQASRRIVVVGAFFVRSAMTARTQRGQPVQAHSLSQLHSYRGRRRAAIRLGGGSWCLAVEIAGSDTRVARLGLQPEPTLAIATDAVSNPTTRATRPGGVAERFKAPVSVGTGTREGLEGSFPSSTTEHEHRAPLLYSDRVVQRRRAGRQGFRPASPSPLIQPQHAAVGRWPAGLCRRGAEGSIGS